MGSITEPQYAARTVGTAANTVHPTISWESLRVYESINLSLDEGVAMKPSTLILCEAASLVLVIITVIHDLTPQSQEGRVRIPVSTPAEAMQKCSEYQDLESRLTNAPNSQRGRTSVRCLLVHPDGTTAQLVPPLTIQ